MCGLMLRRYEFLMPFPIPQELAGYALFLARPDKAEPVGQTFVRFIELSGKHFGFVCPTTGEFKIGPSWADAKFI